MIPIDAIGIQPVGPEACDLCQFVEDITNRNPPYVKLCDAHATSLMEAIETINAVPRAGVL